MTEGPKNMTATEVLLRQEEDLKRPINVDFSKILDDLIEYITASRDAYCEAHCGALEDGDHWQQCKTMTELIIAAAQHKIRIKP